jgi:hypothetical protein
LTNSRTLRGGNRKLGSNRTVKPTGRAIAAALSSGVLRSIRDGIVGTTVHGRNLPHRCGSTTDELNSKGRARIKIELAITLSKVKTDLNAVAYVQAYYSFRRHGFGASVKGYQEQGKKRDQARYRQLKHLVLMIKIAKDR